MTMQRQDIRDKMVNYPNGYPAYHGRTEVVVICFLALTRCVDG